MEAAVDGIIDFKLEEEGKRTRDLMRIRSMRNVHFDREWHELKIGDNFEVTLDQ
jgi:KaiC/GvpD/RAD55 family RecA-like ATPase